MRAIVLMVAMVLFPTLLQAERNGEWCGTPSPSPSLAAPFVEHLEDSIRIPNSFRAPVAIPVAFHVVHDGRNGMISSENISILIGNLNWAFRGSPISFYLHRIDSVKNKSWYRSCIASATNFKKLRKRLALDPRYYLNVYSCKPGHDGLLGMATFPPGYPVPGNPGLNYLQGVTVDPIALGSPEFPYGLVLAHEIGHYLGLFHTFEAFFNQGDNCSEPGDYVGDTATQAFPIRGCPTGLDTCPALPGLDDVPNFMNYASDECMDHFSPGQIELVGWALENYRSSLGRR